MTAPLAVIIDAWLHAREQWEQAAELPGAGNFDTPECEFWLSEMDRHVAAIEATPVQTQQDAAAMIRFIWIDADADRDDWPVVRQSALASIKSWAEMA